tara:strand:- start:10569 stop:11534 length:966 start_codon:yes stop_codon:yes gene_type:complete
MTTKEETGNGENAKNVTAKVNTKTKQNVKAKKKQTQTEIITKPKIEYRKDTFAEYLGSDAIAASDCKKFLESPRKFYYERNNPKVDDPDKRHFAIGSATHELTMEPEYFYENYVVSKKFDKRTKAGKEEFAQFYELNKDKVIINEVEMAMVKEMSANAKLNRTFLEFLEDSICEVSAYTIDEKTGLHIRMRPDMLPQTKNAIVDIKTCRSGSPKGFKKDCYNYGYSLSAAYYTNFLGRENYVFAALENQAPYQTSLYALDDEMMDFGRYQYRMALDLLKWSFDNNYWCDYVEFEILKECYLLDDLSDFFDTLEKSELIQIL